MSRSNRKNKHRADSHATEDQNAEPAYSYPAPDFTDGYSMSTEDALYYSNTAAAIGSGDFPDARLEQGMDSLSFHEDAAYASYAAHYAEEQLSSYNSQTIDASSYNDLQYGADGGYDYTNTATDTAASYPDQQASGSSYQQQPAETEKQNKYECPWDNCTKAFRRTADLERHYKHVHGEESRREHNACDYTKCSRLKEPFSRKDHLRDHFRDFHKEDLPRRSRDPRVDEKWWATRVVQAKWWRCSRCLTRTLIDENGWDCPNCNTTCERERRDLRGVTL